MEIENLNLQKQIDELKEWKDNWLDTVYPIGSIYISTSSSGMHPSDVFGGTWLSWGHGKVPVGIDPNDSDFNTVEKTGGEKTHTLTIQEIPSHTHTSPIDGGSTQGDKLSYAGFANDSRYYVRTSQSGGGNSHNNLQPYITCYMWKRVS